MPTTYLRARDHLQQAAAILRNNTQALQLLNIVERTISLIDDMPIESTEQQNNVLDFAMFKARQGRHH